MAPGERVLALEEEGAGEFEADAHQRGTPDEHGAEGGDRLVQQIVSSFLRDIRLLCGTGGREANVENHARFDRAAPGKRPENG